MDDGTFAKGVLKLCTDNFTHAQVLFLSDMLLSKFDIASHAQHRADGKYRLYIARVEMDKVRALVSPYLIPAMMYKVGL